MHIQTHLNHLKHWKGENLLDAYFILKRLFCKEHAYILWFTYLCMSAFSHFNTYVYSYRKSKKLKTTPLHSEYCKASSKGIWILPSYFVFLISSFQNNDELQKCKWYIQICILYSFFTLKLMYACFPPLLAFQSAAIDFTGVKIRQELSYKFRKKGGRFLH